MFPLNHTYVLATVLLQITRVQSTVIDYISISVLSLEIFIVLLTIIFSIKILFKYILNGLALKAYKNIT